MERLNCLLHEELILSEGSWGLPRYLAVEKDVFRSCSVLANHQDACNHRDIFEGQAHLLPL